MSSMGFLNSYYHVQLHCILANLCSVTNFKVNCFQLSQETCDG